MTYDEIAKASESLTYRDKLRLAQLLVQLARSEEEREHPDRRSAAPTLTPSDPDLLQYVAQRLRKLKASRKEAVLNSIGAMFQFQGGVSDADKERLFGDLAKQRHLVVGENGRISYPEG